MASRTLKKNKRAKHIRTRRQRHRRRQMRGGDFLDIFKPTVKDAAYCQKQFDECTANIKPADSGSSDFFETPSFLKNLFGTKDSTASASVEEGNGEGGEIELEQYPGTEEAPPVAATDPPTVVCPPAPPPPPPIHIIQT